MKRKLKTLMMALVLGLSFTACGQNDTQDKEAKSNVSQEEVAVAEAGSLILKVNPEIKLNFDSEGKVKSLAAENEDAKEILKHLKDYEGKDTSLVVKALIKVIDEKGYFVEEVEGENKEIVIEIEEGSKLPTDDFLDDIVKSVTAFINSGDYEADIYEDDQAKTSQKSKTPARKIGVRPTRGKASRISSQADDTNYDNTNYDNSAYGDDKAKSTNKASIPVNKPANTNDNYDDSNYDSNTNYDDSNYGESQPAHQAPASNDSYDYDDSPYDYSNDSYDDSGYDSYDNSGYDSNDDSGYDDSDYDD